MELLKNVVFLDRDGVINRDSINFIKTWDEFEFLPGSIEAIKILSVNQFTAILITNQSIINRHMAALSDLYNTHARMLKAIESHGGKITDIFFCPHRPDEGCDCRKPKPGLINQAKTKYLIDLGTAGMVGDTVSDIECAQNAGCRYSIILRSRYGDDTEKILEEQKVFPDYIASTLIEAAEWIIKHYEPEK